MPLTPGGSGGPRCLCSRGRSESSRPSRRPPDVCSRGLGLDPSCRGRDRTRDDAIESRRHLGRRVPIRRPVAGAGGGLGQRWGRTYIPRSQPPTPSRYTLGNAQAPCVCALRSHSLRSAAPTAAGAQSCPQRSSIRRIADASAGNVFPARSRRKRSPSVAIAITA
jgi:hypothetical protein